jgi:hypothetical protein
VICGLTGKAAGAHRHADELLDQALAGTARRMGCKIKRRWQANGHTGAAMRYVGLVLEGQAASTATA